MPFRFPTTRLIAAVLTALLAAPLLVPAQVEPADEAGPIDPAPVAQPDAADQTPVAESQAALAARYRRFERLLLQVSEYLRKSDPVKADLLVRAIRQSKEGRITGEMETIINLLQGDQLGDAIQRQEDVISSLRALMYLLNSEDRLDEIAREKERIKDLIKDLNRVIGKEKDVRAGTERRDDAERLAKRQEAVADDARKLTGKIDSQDAQRAREGRPGSGQPKDGEPKDGEPKDGEPKDGEPKDGEPKDGEPKDGEPKDGEPKDGEPKDGEPKDGEPKDGEPKDGEPTDGQPKDGQAGQPKDGQPNQGQPNQGQPNQDQQNQDQQNQDQQNQDQQDPERTPGREEIEQAIREMERAIEELRKKNHENASKEQDEAIRKLLEAKEKLEEILRQLREEERELLLAALEARFQKMLQLQILVYKGTVALDKTPRDDWQDQDFSRSRELAQRENEIALEAAKALTLLKAEGSSVAFPEAVEQLREDMLDVARRLDGFDTTRYTQEIEKDIIEALEEVIEALQREMEKSKQQQQQQQQGQPADPALVDQLAELKMLRSLQLRINRRTRTIGRMIETPEGQATEAALVQDLQELSRRQSRVQQATYDLATGRNQ